MTIRILLVDDQKLMRIGIKSLFEDYPELEIIAETDDKEIMGIKHKEYEIYGVQFHPESIYTSCGKKIIENFLKDVC